MPNDSVHLKTVRNPITKSHSRHSRVQCWSQPHEAGSSCGYSGQFVVTCLLQRCSRWARKKNGFAFCCMFITDPSGLILLTRLFQFPSFMDVPVWPCVWFVKVRKMHCWHLRRKFPCTVHIFTYLSQALESAIEFKLPNIHNNEATCQTFSVDYALFHLITGISPKLDSRTLEALAQGEKCYLHLDLMISSLILIVLPLCSYWPQIICICLLFFLHCCNCRLQKYND